MSSRANTRPTKQPETAEYIQKLIPEKLEDSIEYAGSIEFRFRQHTSEKGYVFPIPGVKTAQSISFKIESNTSLPLVAGDIIRFGRSDYRRWTIQSISFTSDKDENYRRSYLYPNDTEETQFKVIELK